MHMFVGAIFLMLGGACVAYLWAGGSIFEREPPLLAFGILLIVLGAGLGGRARAAAAAPAATVSDRARRPPSGANSPMRVPKAARPTGRAARGLLAGTTTPAAGPVRPIMRLR